MMQILERNVWSMLVASVLLCATGFFAGHRKALNTTAQAIQSASATSLVALK